MTAASGKREATTERADNGLREMPRRLREAREGSGVSLRQLAAKLGISASALSQIETGKSQPTLRTLLALVNELNMSLDALFDLRPTARSR